MGTIIKSNSGMEIKVNYRYGGRYEVYDQQRSQIRGGCGWPREPQPVYVSADYNACVEYIERVEGMTNE